MQRGLGSRHPGLTLQTEPSSTQVHTPRPALLKETPHVYALGPAIQTETPQAYASHPHSANSHVPVPVGYTMPPWFGTTNPQITSPLPPGPDHSIPLPTPPHNSPMQQPLYPSYLPFLPGRHPQRPLSVNMPRLQRGTTEKVKLRVLSHFTSPYNTTFYFSQGQQSDFLFCTDDNPAVIHYYQFRGRCISEVSKRPIPQGHRYDCFKYITQQYIIFQSQQNQLSFYNHDLQLIKTLSCPGAVIGVIGDLYAIVKSITTRQGLPVVTIYITSLTNPQQIHHELESPHPKAYDVDAVLCVCGWLDGRVAITQRGGQYVDFYSITGNHIQRVDVDVVTGYPSCTAQHVLVPIWNPQTILVFTWAGKLVQHLELGLDFYNQCHSISPVHEGKLNVWVYNTSERTYKVITCEIQESEEEDDEVMNMAMDESGH